MNHTEVVDLVRAAPPVVDLVVGRILEAPKFPLEAHLLPDICFKNIQEPLGMKLAALKKKNNLDFVVRLFKSLFWIYSFYAFFFFSFQGLVLDGGRDSIFGVLFVKDIIPGSPASEEGSLKPLDLIHYINGAPTQDLTLSESTRLLELSLDDLCLKATRYSSSNTKPFCFILVTFGIFIFLILLLFIS